MCVLLKYGFAYMVLFCLLIKYTTTPDSDLAPLFSDSPEVKRLLMPGGHSEALPMNHGLKSHFVLTPYSHSSV